MPLPASPQVFQFESCRIDLRGREIWRDGERLQVSAVTFDCLAYLIAHRDRPVGRDELISAVWGRAEVSESTLAHTILRLRNALQDNGNEQRSIRTIPRLGFRWVGDLQLVQEQRSATADAVAEETGQVGAPEVLPELPFAAVDAVETASVGDDEDGGAHTSQRRAGASRVLLAMIGLLVVVGALGYFLYPGPVDPSADTRRSTQTPPQLALVLPVEVNASEEWSWLRFGLMELLVGRLREAGIPTVPSETVLALSSSRQGVTDPFAAAEFEHAVRIRARLEEVDGHWVLSLEVHPPGGNAITLNPAISGNDPAAAARRGADRLLLNWDRVGPRHDEAGDALETLLARVESALLTDQLHEARRLIDQAPEELSHQAMVRSASVWVDCRLSPDESCVERLKGLLVETEGQDQAAHAKLSLRYGNVLVRNGRLDEALTILNDAVELLLALDDRALHIRAYLERGWVRMYRGELDPAAEDIAHARLLADGLGDLAAMAEADSSMAQLNMVRGRPASAERAAISAMERMERLGEAEGWMLSLFNVTEARRYLLDHQAALTGLRALEGRIESLADPQLRELMQLARVDALIDVGRLDEAEEIAESVRRRAPDNESLHFTALLKLVRIALDKGQFALAEQRSSELPLSRAEIFTVNNEDATQVWRLRILALLRNGNLQAAASVFSEMQAESAKREKTVWSEVYVPLTASDMAWSSGRQQEAIRQCERAMSGRAFIDIPLLDVEVAASCTPRLIDIGDLERARQFAGLAGRWSDTDMSAAIVQSQIHRALGDDDAWRALNTRARHLAGQRALPDTTEAPLIMH